MLLTDPDDTFKFTYNRNDDPRLGLIGGVPVGEGRVLSYIKGSESTITPPRSYTPPGDPVPPSSSRVHIDPAEQRLHALSRGDVKIPNDLPSTRAVIELKEKDGHLMTEFVLALEEGGNTYDQIHFRTDGEGKLTDLWTFGESMLKVLGLHVPVYSSSNFSGQIIFRNPEERQAAFERLTEALKYQGAGRLDLHLTLAGLWKALGQSRQDPASLLVFR